jgi:hypothetical protein
MLCGPRPSASHGLLSDSRGQRASSLWRNRVSRFTAEARFRGRPIIREAGIERRRETQSNPGLPASTGPGTELVYAASWFMGSSSSGTMISGAGGRYPSALCGFPRFRLTGRRGTGRRALVVAPHRHHVFHRQVPGIARCKAGSIPASARRGRVTLWHFLAPHGTTGPNQVFRIAK